MQIKWNGAFPVQGREWQVKRAKLWLTVLLLCEAFLAEGQTPDEGGIHDAVRNEDVVLVTETGHEQLTRLSYDAKLSE